MLCKFRNRERHCPGTWKPPSDARNIMIRYNLYTTWRYTSTSPIRLNGVVLS